MIRPPSNDLRERVVTAVSDGETCRAVALRFGVVAAEAFDQVVKWNNEYRITDRKYSLSRWGIADESGETILSYPDQSLAPLDPAPLKIIADYRNAARNPAAAGR